MYTKGQSGNPKGRPKGAKNKINNDLKAFIKSLLYNNIDKIESDFKKLSPKDTLLMFEKLVAYIIPKKTVSDINIDKLTDEQIDEIINNL